MRLLVGDGPTGDIDQEQLERAYLAPPGPWLRVNFVSTVDGAATGDSGTSGSINNAVDKRIFDLLRAQADLVVIGAGTARVEGYRPADTPIVVVTESGRLPESLREASAGQLLVATHAACPRLDELRRDLPGDAVLVLGERQVDLRALREALVARGFENLLCEGGPRLFADLLIAGVVDEVCTTTVPVMVAGQHTRITHGAPHEVQLTLAGLVEEAGTTLARWFVTR